VRRAHHRNGKNNDQPVFGRHHYCATYAAALVSEKSNSKPPCPTERMQGEAGAKRPRERFEKEMQKSNVCG
jgi:hypothetical protein